MSRLLALFNVRGWLPIPDKVRTILAGDDCLTAAPWPASEMAAKARPG
ncbi:MAG: hypothetical protein LBT47_09235 [Deltaproteobacteria bacterium]|nr:hypothetical protein [Deltaproteobacteria bacterium]